MGPSSRRQPARGRAQPDRYTHVNAPKKRATLSRAAQRRCSAQTPPPSVFWVVGEGGSSRLAHVGTVALPPCRAAPPGCSATTLGACFMDPYLNGPTNADTQLACPDFFGPQETSVGVAFWKVQAVKDLRVVDGKREWLIGWAGADDEGVRGRTPGSRPSSSRPT